MEEVSTASKAALLAIGSFSQTINLTARMKQARQELE
jgi:hypothetical protein